MSQTLLADIQRFAMGKNIYHRDDPAESNLVFILTFLKLILFCLPFVAIKMVRVSLNLLEELPVLRDSIFDYFSIVFDAYIANFIKQEVVLIPFSFDSLKFFFKLKENIYF